MASPTSEALSKAVQWRWRRRCCMHCVRLARFMTECAWLFGKMKAVCRSCVSLCCECQCSVFIMRRSVFGPKASFMRQPNTAAVSRIMDALLAHAS